MGVTNPNNIKVYTNLKTLIKAKRVLNKAGIGFLLDGNTEEAEPKGFMDMINLLIEGGKIIEFVQTITRDDETDFAEMQAPELGAIIDSFFTDTGKLLPSFIRQKIGSFLNLIISS